MVWCASVRTRTHTQPATHLEAEEVEREISLVLYLRIDDVAIFHDNFVNLRLPKAQRVRAEKRGTEKHP